VPEAHCSVCGRTRDQPVQRPHKHKPRHHNHQILQLSKPRLLPPQGRRPLPSAAKLQSSDHVRLLCRQVDTVVWCTGYDYSFPFLEGSGLLTPPVSARVHPLYEQLFHVRHPSLSFIGLQQRYLLFFVCCASPFVFPA